MALVWPPQALSWEGWQWVTLAPSGSPEREPRTHQTRTSTTAGWLCSLAQPPEAQRWPRLPPAE